MTTYNQQADDAAHMHTAKLPESIVLKGSAEFDDNKLNSMI
jgi:hypothetical protein